MMIGGAIALPEPGLYDITEHVQTGYSDTAGRTQVSPVIGAESTAIIFCVGQSVIANQNGSLNTPTQSLVHQINLYDGLAYEMKDPVLGAAGSGEGTYITKLGDKLINNSVWERIIFVPIAIGGTSVNDWETVLRHRLDVAIKRAREHNYTVTAIMWDQGGRDTNAGTSQADYEASLNSIINSSVTWGPVTENTPWYLAKSTLADDTTPGPNIRAAIDAVVASNPIAFAGADLDTLTGATYRQPASSHLTDTGTDVASDLWLAVFQSAFP